MRHSWRMKMRWPFLAAALLLATLIASGTVQGETLKQVAAEVDSLESV